MHRGCGSPASRCAGCYSTPPGAGLGQRRQLNRFDWYSAHNWSVAYPGDKAVLRPIRSRAQTCHLDTWATESHPAGSRCRGRRPQGFPILGG